MRFCIGCHAEINAWGQWCRRCLDLWPPDDMVCETDEEEEEQC